MRTGRVTTIARYVMIVATAALTSVAVAPSAAAERTWDIEEYDRCMKPTNTITGSVGSCCNLSGGDLTQDNPPKCVTPPPERVSQPRMPRNLPSGTSRA